MNILITLCLSLILCSTGFAQFEEAELLQDRLTQARIEGIVAAPESANRMLRYLQAEIITNGVHAVRLISLFENYPASDEKRKIAKLLRGKFFDPKAPEALRMGIGQSRQIFTSPEIFTKLAKRFIAQYDSMPDVRSKPSELQILSIPLAGKPHPPPPRLVDGLFVFAPEYQAPQIDDEIERQLRDAENLNHPKSRSIL